MSDEEKANLEQIEKDLWQEVSQMIKIDQFSL